MIGETDAQRRQQHVLRHLAERGASTDLEAERLRSELSDLTRREAVLREEITTLDAILAAIPEPRRESEAPSLFAPVPKPAPAVPAEALPRHRRRRKGSRREEMLPRLRAKFGAGTFGAEDVTDLVMEAEGGGERRKAYFAAWSLCRDLLEDGEILVVAEEGEGRRKKRTFRFSEPPSPPRGQSESAPDPGLPAVD